MRVRLFVSSKKQNVGALRKVTLQDSGRRQVLLGNNVFDRSPEAVQDT